MNFPTDIPELEADLARVLGIQEARERAIAKSAAPDIESIFLSSTMRLREELERRLRAAKAERAHEVVSLRLSGAQLAEGRMPLRLLPKLTDPLNAALEQSAWRVWDSRGDASRIDPGFIRELDLQLADIGAGSTRLAIVGNTAPDLTGVSALETALRDVFDVLAADVDAMMDRVHAIGFRAGKSLCDFLRLLERENLAVDLTWTAPDQAYEWHGNAQEVTRVRALLDDIGQPTTTTESFCGQVNVLSIRNRMEIERLDTHEKIRLSYHKSLTDSVQQLRLADELTFKVEKTMYPFVASSRKRNAYRLVDLEAKAIPPKLD